MTNTIATISEARSILRKETTRVTSIHVINEDELKEILPDLFRSFDEFEIKVSGRHVYLIIPL